MRKRTSRIVHNKETSPVPFGQESSVLIKYLKERHPSISFINTDIRSESEDVQEHMHADLFQLTHYSQGSGEFTIFNRKYNIAGDTFFIVNPNELHLIRPKGEVPLKGIGCRFMMPGLHGKILSPAIKVEARILPEAEMLLKKALAEAVLKTDRSMIKASFFLAELLMLLDEMRSSNLNESLSDAVRKGIIFMNASYKMNITIDDVASRSGVTMSHFCRIFKKEMGGVSPLSYLRKMRLGFAAERLFTTREKISSIAANSGFRNAKNLNMAFKHEHKMSTQEFRRRKFEEVPIGLSSKPIARKMSDS